MDSELATALRHFRRAAAPAPADRLQAMRHDSGRFSAPLSRLERAGRIVIETLRAEGGNGPPVDLLIFRPHGRRKVRACVYHIHGGGMVTGDSRTSIEPILDWVEALQVMVVSLTYRLAPEHPFPAAVDDCYAGLRWVADNAGWLGYAAGKLMIAGASAGGGLAACTTLLARDRGSPPVLGTILMSPMLDDRTRAAAKGTDGVWDHRSNEFAWAAVLGHRRGAADVSPYAAAAREDTPDRLPPVYLDVGSAEILRAEAVEFAGRIWAAGGTAELHVWPGAYHGFDVIAPDAQISMAAAAARLSWLQRLLALSTETAERQASC